jgi:hypothetical protein
VIATLRNLVSVVYRPSDTMRGVLAQPRDGAVLPLVAAALMSLFLREFSKPSFNVAVQRSQASVVVTVLGVLCVVFVTALLLFFLFAALVLVVGRIFEGEGTMRQVRSALAWALAPEIWALLYRIPLAFSGGSSMSTAGTVLDVVTLIWTLALVAFTLAEALRFSPLSAFGTVVLSTIAPVIMLAGAVLVIEA